MTGKRENEAQSEKISGHTGEGEAQNPAGEVDSLESQGDRKSRSESTG